MAVSNPKYVKLVKNDFDILSKSYDLINNFMSLGTDRQFRYLAIKNLLSSKLSDKKELVTFLDIGTGTGHLSEELHRQDNGSFVVGMDITRGMLEYSKDRTIYHDGCMNLILGDAAKTPFRSKSFDGGMSAFVGRHFTNYTITLNEHNRILRNKGRLMMLEMGRHATPISFIVDTYVGQMMSILGKLAVFIVTGGKAPFRLLEETYARYYSPNQLKKFYEDAGFLTRYKLGLIGSIVIILALKI